MANGPTGPLSPHERYLFDLQGFVVRRGVLSRHEVEAINTAIDLLGMGSAGNDVRTQRFSGFLPGARCFRDLIDHPGVLGMLIDLCGEFLRLDHAYGIAMNPGTNGLGLHGGGSPPDPAQEYRVQDGRIINGLVAVQWALVDHRQGDGGFGCVPGSHKANFPLPSPVPREWVVEVPMAAGDLVVFTEALTHCTLQWNALSPRRTLLYKYSPGYSSWGLNYAEDLRELAISGLLTPRDSG